MSSTCFFCLSVILLLSFSITGFAQNTVTTATEMTTTGGSASSSAAESTVTTTAQTATTELDATTATTANASTTTPGESTATTQNMTTTQDTAATTTPDSSTVTAADESTSNNTSVELTTTPQATSEPTTSEMMIKDSLYTLTLSGNCTVIKNNNLEMSFKEKLTEKLVAQLKVNESRLSLGDVTCGSVVINVTVTDTQNTDIKALLKAGVNDVLFNVFLTVDNLTYIYTAKSVEVLSEPPMPTTMVQTTTPAAEPDGTGMPVPGVNNEERIRMIIIIACAVGGGMIVLIIFGCCIFCCCQRCKNNSGSFSLGDTPSAYVKSEDVLLEKMPRTPGYYGDEGYVVKAEYQDGNGQNKTSPDSGTFSMAEAQAQNDDNQNEKSNHYDNRNHDDGDVAGRRLSREALVKDQRSESPGYDNPSFSEDEILGGPEEGGYTIEESEYQTEPATIPQQQTEPVTYSVETDPPPQHPEPASFTVVSEVDPDSNQNDSKHSSLSNVSSVSIEAESFPPPPAFITNNVATDTDSHDGGSNLEPQNQSDQVESSEVTLPADHIEVTLTPEDQNPSTEICDDHRSSSPEKDQQNMSSNNSETSSSDSDSKHSYNVNSENQSLSHKDSAPTIEFPPPPEDAPETADQGSITELDYNDDDDLHQHHHHESPETEEKTTAEKEAESATLF